ncbi:MAG: hypothetical protein KJ767_04175 [Nanoarchaeota archaeon]|nr:hypothetical protein [Nanoarchaeota archaeon]
MKKKENPVKKFPKTVTAKKIKKRKPVIEVKMIPKEKVKEKPIEVKEEKAEEKIKEEKIEKKPVEIKEKEEKKPEIAEPIIMEWLDALREKQKAFEEFRDKSLKDMNRKLVNKIKRKDQQIFDIRKEVERQKNGTEVRVKRLRDELNEKKKLIQELQGKLNKIVNDLKIQ